ncbi:hypothetical protein [Parvularcula sp. LCG005]|uniref:hypothetical protein n=1 Tax=Parvularcula sp. LCG005 TaxID=3078805 RepID=UPI0029437A11|nr:hypothetical protein [Parvularcula sp. LCG005]WOI52783.1 hypothetical protein RUI03_11560 [Parvularcula sp. LCG005]
MSAVFVGGLSGVAFAQSDDVIFNGTIADSCTVVAGSAGTIAASTDSTVLSSTEAGGSAGDAAVTANSAAYQVTVSAPTAFDSAPAGSDTNTTFAASYAASGATTASGVNAGVQTAINAGETTITVDASATKSVGTYAAGSYQLTTTVTCSTS